MGDWIKSELARLYERATKTGEARLARQPRAAKAHYDARKSLLVWFEGLDERTRALCRIAYFCAQGVQLTA
jgi:hypothetical protein